MGSRTSKAVFCERWVTPLTVLLACSGTAGCREFFCANAFDPFWAAGCTAPLALALVTLEVDSAFDTGQNPPLCFFLAGTAASPFAECAVSFVDVTVVAEEVDEFEANDDDEALLVTTLRCGMNIRETSSLLIAEKPPWWLAEGPSQPSLGNDWKVGGDCTIVVMGVSGRGIL